MALQFVPLSVTPQHLLALKNRLLTHFCPLFMSMPLLMTDINDSGSQTAPVVTSGVEYSCPKVSEGEGVNTHSSHQDS